jgi:hypothetical protein
MAPTRTLAALTAVVAMSLGAACAPRSSPVALDAGPASREALLGSWRGSYDIDRRRGGVISFTLQPGEHDAHGDVLMIPNGVPRPYARALPDGLARADGPTPEPLTIRFVRADDGRVSGTLTPYWDPDRSCTATATFSGIVDGGTMRGTFVSTCDRAAPTYTGRWAMRRRR